MPVNPVPSLVAAGTIQQVAAQDVQPGDRIANFIHNQSSLVEARQDRREADFDFIELTLWVEPLGGSAETMIGVTVEPTFQFQVVREIGR
jgi:hypothetical protein